MGFEQAVDVFRDAGSFESGCAERIADGWVLHAMQIAAVASPGYSSQMWVVSWRRGAGLSVKALAWLAACPDPDVKAEASAAIAVAARA